MPSNESKSAARPLAARPVVLDDTPPAEKEKNPPNKAGDGGEAEVQEKFDKANDQGFFGVEVDQTPNENYTVDGVTSGKPTPETELQGEAAKESEK